VCATGGHTSEHFALYYGFVPHPNPHDKLQVSLSDVLSTCGAKEPEGGWGEAIAALEGAERGSAAGDAAAAAAGDGLAARLFDLKACGPSRDLITTLTLLLSSGDDDDDEEDGEGRACAAVARTIQAIEGALWGYAGGGEGDEEVVVLAAEEAKSIQSDEAMLALPTRAAAEEEEEEADEESTTLSEEGAVLVSLRLGRKRLLAALRQSLMKVAKQYESGDWKWGERDLELMVEAAEEGVNEYPGLDEVAVEVMTAWPDRDWEWSEGRWRA